MGSDKANLVVGGGRLVDRVHGRLSAVANPVFFAPGQVGRLGPLPGVEVADARADSGPLGGLVAGLSASPHELQAMVAVDMPWCSGEVFELLARLWDGEDALVPVDADGPQVLHALYARRSVSVLQGGLEKQELGLRRVVDDLNVRYVDEDEWRVADPSGRFAVNLNRPQDLALLGDISQ